MQISLHLQADRLLSENLTIAETLLSSDNVSTGLNITDNTTVAPPHIVWAQPRGVINDNKDPLEFKITLTLDNPQLINNLQFESSDQLHLIGLGIETDATTIHVPVYLSPLLHYDLPFKATVAKQIHLYFVIPYPEYIPVRLDRFIKVYTTQADVVLSYCRIFIEKADQETSQRAPSYDPR